MSKVKPITDKEIYYKKTFVSPEGKLVLDDLRKLLRYGQTTYQPGKSEADNAFEQGRQSVINEIIYTLNKTETSR